MINPDSICRCPSCKATISSYMLREGAEEGDRVTCPYCWASLRVENLRLSVVFVQVKGY